MVFRLFCLHIAVAWIQHVLGDAWCDSFILHWICTCPWDQSSDVSLYSGIVSYLFGCQLCPSQYRQLKAEGVPMIVKLRTGLRQFEDSDQMCHALRMHLLCRHLPENIHWIYAGGENLRMPPVLSLCFKEATRKQAWGDSNLLETQRTYEINHSRFRSSGVGLLCPLHRLLPGGQAYRQRILAHLVNVVQGCRATMQLRVSDRFAQKRQCLGQLSGQMQPEPWRQVQGVRPRQ